MQTVEIKMRVPRQTAQSYLSASPEEQERIRMIVEHSVKALSQQEQFETATSQLEQTLDEIGAKAEAKGATEELINALLNDK